MSMATYPLAADLVAFMGGLPEPLTVTEAVAGRCISRAVTELEERTGFRPFLGSSVAGTYTYDPPTGSRYRLNLGTGFWEITEVRVDAYSGYAGTVLDASAYDLLPLNADEDGWPWTDIQFRNYPGSNPASIKVTGKKGFAAEISDGMWQSLLERSASLALPSTFEGDGAIVREKQGDRERQFASDPTNGRIALWNSNFDADVMRVTRISL